MMTETKTTKQKIKDFVYYNWYVLLIIALCIGMVFQYQLNQSTEAEVLKLNSALTVKEKVDSIDSKLTEMSDREKNLYPNLDAKIADLEAARKQFQSAESKLKQPNRGEVTNEINKLNENEVSKLLTDLGYPSSVRPSK